MPNPLFLTDPAKLMFTIDTCHMHTTTVFLDGYVALRTVVG